MLALRVDPLYLDGDLADQPDQDGVLTEATIALLSDARVADDELDPGRDNRGYWADSVLGEEEPLGSRMWLLESSASTAPDVLSRAEAYAAEKLDPLVRTGRLVSWALVKITASETHVELSARLTLPGGQSAHLGLVRVN